MELITKIETIIKYINKKYNVEKESTKAYFKEENTKFYLVISIKFWADDEVRLIYIEDIIFATITNTELDDLIRKNIMSSYIEENDK